MKQLRKYAFGVLLGCSMVAALAFAMGAGYYQSKTIDAEYMYFPAAKFDTYTTTVPLTATGFSYHQRISSGVGGAFTEVGGRGYNGVAMTTADDIRRVMRFPSNIDTRYNMATRVHYTSLSTATTDGKIDWEYRTIPSPIGSALTDIAGTGVGATGGYKLIQSAADSCTAQFQYRVTKWDTIPRAQMQYYDTNKMWVHLVELADDGDASADEIIFIGHEIAYVPKNETGVYRDSIEALGPTVNGVAKSIMLKK